MNEDPMAARMAQALDTVLGDPEAIRLLGEFYEDRFRDDPAYRALADQVMASVVESQSGAVRRALLPDQTYSVAGRGAMPEWVRLGALHALMSVPTSDSCACNISLDRPQPMVASAWRPGLVTCVPHARLHSLGVTPEQDRTCDFCGRTCAGVAVDDGIHPFRATVISMTYMVGLCKQCLPPEFVGKVK